MFRVMPSFLFLTNWNFSAMCSRPSTKSWFTNFIFCSQSDIPLESRSSVLPTLSSLLSQEPVNSSQILSRSGCCYSVLLPVPFCQGDSPLGDLCCLLPFHLIHEVWLNSTGRGLCWLTLVTWPAPLPGSQDRPPWAPPVGGQVQLLRIWSKCLWVQIPHWPPLWL